MRSQSKPTGKLQQAQRVVLEGVRQAQVDYRLHQRQCEGARRYCGVLWNIADAADDIANEAHDQSSNGCLAAFDRVTDHDSIAIPRTFGLLQID